jgi:hypothetical protein
VATVTARGLAPARRRRAVATVTSAGAGAAAARLEGRSGESGVTYRDRDTGTSGRRPSEAQPPGLRPILAGPILASVSAPTPARGPGRRPRHAGFESESWHCDWRRRDSDAAAVTRAALEPGRPAAPAHPTEASGPPPRARPSRRVTVSPARDRRDRDMVVTSRSERLPPEYVTGPDPAVPGGGPAAGRRRSLSLVRVPADSVRQCHVT